MRWWKILGILVVLFVTARIVPSNTLDTWGLFNPRKIATMVFAIALIQAMGGIFVAVFGTRVGTIFAGIFGGLVSSTAVTASLARTSKSGHERDTATESLLYFCATLAMLLEAVLLVKVGTPDLNPAIFVLFMGPLLLTCGGIVGTSRVARNKKLPLKEQPELNLSSILKLSAFIFLVLTLSKIGQNIFGQSGLIGLTFIVSLFEIHAPVIANVELQGNGEISLSLLGALLSVSLTASYLSKLFIIYSLGSPSLAKEIRNWTGWVLASLGASWMVFQLLIHSYCLNRI